MNIPYTFRNQDADYLTIPCMKEFCSEQKIGTRQTRDELIKLIEDYASLNDYNCEVVQSWLDTVLKIGIKTCMMAKIHYTDELNETVVLKKIKTKYPSCSHEHICQHTPKDDFELINYRLVRENGELIKIEFVFIIKIVRAIDMYSSSGVTIAYPIFVDIDLKNYFYICRAKSMSNIFKIDKDNEINPSKRIYPETLMKHCENIVRKVLEYQVEETRISKNAFKRTIFNILDEYTQTPAVIKKDIDTAFPICEAFVKKIFSELKLTASREAYNDALYDLTIFIEKYSSILYPNDDIFIQDRKAYPVKFLAQDNEFTKIQETSNGNTDPLQRKKAFFDSKKTIYTDKKCDKICLCHQREETKYYGRKPYNVQIFISGSSCVVKFSSFVKEGDIQNVLSRVIQLYNVQR